MYATLTDLKTYKGITTTGDDTLLTDLLADAQDILERAYQRIFEASADSTHYFDPSRDVKGRTLYFDDDLATITSITNGDGVAVSASDYVLEPRNGTPKWGVTLKLGANLAWAYDGSPENSIIVVGKWAWSTTVPRAVKRATIRMAAYLYDQRKNAGDMDRPVYVGNAVILPSDLPKDIQRMMAFALRTV